MKILITGANGFIGKNLSAELKNQGYEDLLLCTRDTTEDILKTYTHECDVVFHLAGINRTQNIEEFETGNVAFLKHMLTLIEQNPKKPCIIFSSSIQAEADNPYGKSKKKAEKLLESFAKEHGNKVLIYRLPNVFGKWGKPNYNSVVATFCYKMGRDLEIHIDDANSSIELVYIDDVVKEFIDQLKNGNTVQIYKNVQPVYKITVGELAKMVERFASVKNTLQVPDMENAFEKKLFSTYLSYLDKEDFLYPLKMHKDIRGSFTEFIHIQRAGQVSVNISKPGVTKGNHWHQTKVEKFLVVQGTALIRFRHIITKEICEYKVSGDKLEVVDIPVGYTHNITNIGKNDLITVMWANEIFDQEKPDTYYEEV